MNESREQCEWAGCERHATDWVDFNTPVCEHHAAVADWLLLVEVGFVLGLSVGGIRELISPG